MYKPEVLSMFGIPNEFSNYPKKTCIFIDGLWMDRKELQVHSIDPYLTGSAEEQASGIFDDFNLKAEQTFVDRCKSYSYNNIIKIRKTSMEACPDFATGSLDCVYIDGEHNYEHINNDITNWYPKLKKGGILSGHDYDPHHSATIHSVLTRLNLLNDTFTTYPDTSWSVIIQ